MVPTRHHGFVESAAVVLAVLVLAASFVLFAHSVIWVVGVIAAIALLRLGSSRARSTVHKAGR